MIAKYCKTSISSWKLNILFRRSLAKGRIYYADYTFRVSDKERSMLLENLCQVVETSANMATRAKQRQMQPKQTFSPQHIDLFRRSRVERIYNRSLYVHKGAFYVKIRSWRGSRVLSLFPSRLMIYFNKRVLKIHLALPYAATRTCTHAHKSTWEQVQSWRYNFAHQNAYGFRRAFRFAWSNS